jgi:hypothetical protein
MIVEMTETWSPLNRIKNILVFDWIHIYCYCILNLFQILHWFCFQTSSSFNFLRLNLSTSNLCAANLHTANLFLTPKDHSRPEVHTFISQKGQVLRWGVVNNLPYPQAWWPPLVSCPLLLIQYSRSCPPYWRQSPIRNLRTRRLPGNNTDLKYVLIEETLQMMWRWRSYPRRPGLHILDSAATRQFWIWW